MVTERGFEKKLYEELEVHERFQENGYLTEDQLEEVVKMKDTQPLHQIRQNSEEEIRNATKNAIDSESITDAVNHLTSLHGIGVVMSSAILTAYDNEEFCMIDNRVIRYLHQREELLSVDVNGHSTEEYEKYLEYIRNKASEKGKTARELEYELYKKDKEENGVIE